MKVDLEHLANARAQSFNSLLSQISEARKTIADASASHKEQINNDSEAAVTAWIKHVEDKATQRGMWKGYATACDHMLGLLDQIAADVKNQYEILENAIKEVQSVENLLDKASEDEQGPLG